MVTIEQTVEIPASRRLTFDIPEEVPMGKARVVIQFPVLKETQNNGSVPPEAKGQSNNEAFRRAIGIAYGAWKDNPWINHLEDINATVLSNDTHLRDYHRPGYTAMPCVLPT